MALKLSFPFSLPLSLTIKGWVWGFSKQIANTNELLHEVAIAIFEKVRQRIQITIGFEILKNSLKF